MRLNNIFCCSLLSIVFIISCTQKDKYKDYNLFIRNNSSQDLRVISYKDNIEIDNILIGIGERGLECNLVDVRRISYSLCDNLDSIKFVFPNDKGYSCSISDESLCFGDGSPESGMAPWYLNDKFINISGDTYEFTITQEDYNNALDLP